MNKKMYIEKKPVFKQNSNSCGGKALAVSWEVYEKVMDLKKCTGWSAKEITDRLLLFALDNVEIESED